MNSKKRYPCNHCSQRGAVMDGCALDENGIAHGGKLITCPHCDGYGSLPPDPPDEYANKLISILRKLEWSNDGFCPCCRYYLAGKHRETCELKEALNETM